MDLNAIRKRLGQLQTTNNRTSSLWKPQPGKTQIRIVPYEFNKDNPFIELFFHYNLNNRSYLSPISFGRPDPIEEFAQKLKGSGNKEGREINGRDVVVEFISAEESGASFPTTKIRVKPNQTPISDDPTILEKVKSSQKDIRDIYQEQSYDDLTNVLNEWLNPSEDSSEQSAGTTQPQANETSTSTMEEKKVKDTSEAFDELFNS
jgi:hypothetical protein